MSPMVYFISIEGLLKFVIVTEVTQLVFQHIHIKKSNRSV